MQDGHEAVILECDLTGPVIASRGAILHGLTGLSGPVEVPEDTVVHQLPVEEAANGGWVIRAYGVEDDPKQPIETATWFNQPILETLERLGIRSEEVWDADGADTLECGIVSGDDTRRGLGLCALDDGLREWIQR